jgi:hypothetical protein
MVSALETKIRKIAFNFHMRRYAKDVAASMEVYNQGKQYGVPGRGLHSFTFQLNLSALYEIGGARKGCVARVKGC